MTSIDLKKFTQPLSLNSSIPRARGCVEIFFAKIINFIQMYGLFRKKQTSDEMRVQIGHSLEMK